MRGEQRAYPLRFHQAADECEGDRIRGFRRGPSARRCRRRSPGSARCGSPFTPRRSITARSSRFCTSTAEREAVQQPAQRQRHDRRAPCGPWPLSLMNIVPRPVMALRQTTGRPVAASDPTTVAGNGDVMGEIGLEAAVELAHLAHDPDKVARIEAAAAPGDGMQMKPFGLDGGAMAVNAGCDVHLEAGVAGGARHRQAMGDEVPVLGHEIDDARRRSAHAARRQAGVCGIRSCVRELRDRANDVIEAGCPRRLEDEDVVGAPIGRTRRLVSAWRESAAAP